jgi:hypothetical protein
MEQPREQDNPKTPQEVALDKTLKVLEENKSTLERLNDR